MIHFEPNPTRNGIEEKVSGTYRLPDCVEEERARDIPEDIRRMMGLTFRDTEWDQDTFQTKYKGKVYLGRMEVSERTVELGREGEVTIVVENPTGRKLNRFLNKIEECVLDHLPRRPLQDHYI